MATKTFKIGLSNTDKQNMAQDVYERLLALTFPEYDTTTEYEVGDFVVYNDQLYKCIGATSGAWDSTKWQLATLNDLVTDIEDAVQFVNDKANVDGNYPTLTAGLADNLTPYSEDSGAEQDNPFISNGTGTNNNTEIVTVGDYALFKEKQGHTLVVNQLAKAFSDNSWDATGSTKSVVDGVLTFTATQQYGNTILNTTLVNGHKYIVSLQAKLTTAGANVGIGLGDNAYLTGQGVYKSLSNIVNTNWNYVTFVGTFASMGYSQRIVIADFRSSDWDAVQIKDLFVIDLTQMFNGDQDIIDDLTAHPEHFFRYYQGSLAYNAGSLVNANGVKIVSTGRNLFDGTHDFFVAPNRPYHCLGTATITYKDKDGNTISSESVANTTFTTPNNCVIVGASGSGQITISPYYTPEEGGEDYDKHYNYEEPYVVETGNEVLRQAGSVKDYKTPDGTIHRLVGARAYQSGDENDSDVITDGTTTYYPLATPTTEQGTPFAENLPINDYGMLYWLNSSNNLVGIPQGAKIFYPVNYKGFVDDVYARTDGDASKLVIQSERTADNLARDNADAQLQNTIGGTLRQCLCVKESLDFENTAFVDLGSLNYTKTTSGLFSTSLSGLIKAPTSSANVTNSISTLYKAITSSAISGPQGSTPSPDLVFAVSPDGSLFFNNLAYTDATAFKNAMNGVLLAYEKAE